MRVLVLVKANKESEAGLVPDKKTQEMFAEMDKFNDQLIDAGIMQAGEGLHPSSKGKRVRFDGDKRTVIDGPFPETKELVAGYWIWKVKSLQEAVDWLKRAPFDRGAEPAEVEIRPIYATEELGDLMTPEMKAHDQRQRERLARNQ
jgi:hypothetical protein